MSVRKVAAIIPVTAEYLAEVEWYQHHMAELRAQFAQAWYAAEQARSTPEADVNLTKPCLRP